MPENLFETRYDLTKKSKLREFYESNKILIYSSILTLIIIFASYSYYQVSKERKKILLSENYIQAKIYLESGNKTEALEILKTQIPDAIILDIMMPNVDGYATLEHIKKNNALQDCKVIFLSAKNKESDIQKGLDLGASAYLTKPFSLKKLVDQVKELIE